MKIAAFDFDGTILFGRGIHPDIAEAIKAWQAAGHLAVAATGKSLSAANFALKDSDVTFDFSVLFSGAVVTDRDGEILHSATLPHSVVHGLVEEMSRPEGVAVFGTRLHGRDVCFSSTFPGMDSSVLLDFGTMTIDDIHDHEFVGVPIAVPIDDDLRSRTLESINKTYDVECAMNQIFIDVIPAGSSKGAGLEWLVNHLEVPRDDIELYTFGDSWNDLTMHAIADQSFSFQWSPPDVQAATDEVIKSVAETLPRFLSGST